MFYILLLYFCHIQQGNGDIMCIESQGHLLYFFQLQKKYLEIFLFNLYGPDESQVYIKYQRLQCQLGGSSHILCKIKVIYLKRW